MDKKHCRLISGEGSNHKILGWTIGWTMKPA
nr:MAG TPA: hypothetical protein [Bacteriophage sp.]